MEANRPTTPKPVVDAAKVPPTPSSPADAKAKPDVRRVSDGEKAQPLQQLDPAHRLSMPAELREVTAHGHSPEIPWPAEAESQNPRPFKGMK
jgi:hypothetical protein